MLLVVADTSPVRYLVRIGLIHLVPQLFGRVVLPSVVVDELRHPSAPHEVQSWIQHPPGWVEIRTAPQSDDPALAALDPGERSAIALGLSLKADLILIDERRGAKAAAQKGFAVTGTLGILDVAAGKGLVDLQHALELLTSTSFRYRRELLDALLRRHTQGEL